VKDAAARPGHAFEPCFVDENAMDDYLGFIEFFVVALFAGAWAILEWQGRRLDRKRDAARAKEEE
jgi:hypothetical protein